MRISQARRLVPSANRSAFFSAFTNVSWTMSWARSKSPWQNLSAARSRACRWDSIRFSKLVSIEVPSPIFQLGRNGYIYDISKKTLALLEQIQRLTEALFQGVDFFQALGKQEQALHRPESEV